MITSFLTPWNDQQHIFYIGENALLHELYLTERWHFTNVSSQIPALQQWPNQIRGYTTPWNLQEHVIVLGSAVEIAEVYFDGRWHLNWLKGGDGINRQINSALHGHVTSWNKQQHVIFIDRNDHINELYYLDGAERWGRNDLTALATAANDGIPVGVAGASQSGGQRDITSYSTDWNGQQHVNYVDALGFINELWFDGSNWHHNNLTTLAPGAEDSQHVSGGVAIAGYVTEWNRQEHVVYIDVNGHINELYYS
jgi:hypothetical protein